MPMPFLLIAEELGLVMQLLLAQICLLPELQMYRYLPQAALGLSLLRQNQL
jgi:hypothetical protein